MPSKSISVLDDPYATAEELAAYLTTLTTAYPEGPLIYPTVISFLDAKNKANSAMPETQSNGTLYNFETSFPWGKRNVKLALMIFPTESWVSANTLGSDKLFGWERNDYHAAAVAVIRWGRKKDLLVFDVHSPPWDKETRIPEYVKGLPKKYWSVFRPARTFHSTDSSHDGEGRCLYYACRQLKRWAALGAHGCEDHYDGFEEIFKP